MIQTNDLRDRFASSTALDPHRRHDFEFTCSLKDSAGNGDPENEGRPRQYPDGRLLASDAFLKRATRDFMEEVLGLPVYISRKAKEEGLSLKDLSSKYPSLKEAIDHWIDVKLFGAAYLSGGKGGNNYQILGPVQIGMGSSKDPVELMEYQVSRILKEDNSDGTFGSKAIVEYAELVFEGRYSGNVGRRHGVTEEDLFNFWLALINGLELRQSTMSGQRRAVKLVIKSFDDEYGMKDSKTMTLTFA
jgi:Cas7 group CRISPR-associated protein Csh2